MSHGCVMGDAVATRVNRRVASRPAGERVSPCAHEMPDAISATACLLQSEITMRPVPLIAAVSLATGCIGNESDTNRRTASKFTAAVEPITTIGVIGADTLSDSARIHQLEPEPDGRSIAFLFADPAKGVSRGLALFQTTGTQGAQLVWPDSVMSVWWATPHQLAFTAGTGQGVRVVVDAHAAQLEALETSRATSRPPSDTTRGASEASRSALDRAQRFIDSLRVQPQGTPQGSALRYRPDTILVGPGDSLAAAHVSATDAQGSRSNPAWYVVHLPSGQVQAVDSLIGRSIELAPTAAKWGHDGTFYYAKGQSIWRVRPTAN